MTANVNFPRNFTIGDLKDLIADLPSDGLVEFFYVESCGCCVGSQLIEKSKVLKFFQFRKEIDVSREDAVLRVPILCIGRGNSYDNTR